MSWTPGAYDLHIVRGDDWEQFFLLRDRATQDPLDVTGWTGAAQIKTAIDGTLLQTCTVTTGTNGFLVSLTDVQTTALVNTLAGANGVWDLQLTNDSGFIRTWVKGIVTTEKDVTNSA